MSKTQQQPAETAKNKGEKNPTKDVIQSLIYFSIITTKKGINPATVISFYYVTVIC